MTKSIKPYIPFSNFPLKLVCVYSKYSSDLPKNNIMAHKGDIEGIKNIVSLGVILSEDTILTFALCGNKNGVDELLKLKKTTGENMFVLSVKLFNCACASGNVELIKFLQEKGCEENESSILEIIGNGHKKETIIWALKNLRYIGYDKYHQTNMITAAVGSGNLDIVKFLINNGYMKHLSKTKIEQPNLNDISIICATSQLPLIVFKPMLEYLIQKNFSYCKENISIPADEEYEEKYKLICELCV